MDRVGVERVWVVDSGHPTYHHGSIASYPAFPTQIFSMKNRERKPGWVSHKAVCDMSLGGVYTVTSYLLTVRLRMGEKKVLRMYKGAGRQSK